MYKQQGYSSSSQVEVFATVTHFKVLLCHRIACMFDVHTCFLASSSEKETDVGRMNEKHHSLAHLGDVIIGKQG